jgi:YfiR/HmsC-like
MIRTHRALNCKRFAFGMLLLILVFLALRATTEAQSSDEEYQVKAAFLYHFAQLVDWPPDKQSSADHSLSLCTLGNDPFRGALEDTVAGKPVGNKIIRIHHLKDTDDTHACQILFVDRSQSKRIPALVADLQAAPVLTVGESNDFLRDGGMICFLLVENRVRFAVNLAAADSAKLKIGSRLLILAQNFAGQHSEK